MRRTDLSVMDLIAITMLNTARHNWLYVLSAMLIGCGSSLLISDPTVLHLTYWCITCIGLGGLVWVIVVSYRLTREVQFRRFSSFWRWVLPVLAFAIGTYMR